MNSEIFAEWLRRQGFSVFHSPSSYWVDTGAHALQAFPYHWVIQPSQEELSQLFHDTHTVAIRYSTPIEFPQGKISYHVLCENKNYGLNTLNRQSRQNVLRGLEYACVERIPLKKLAYEGWQLRQDTLARQCRCGAENEKWWRNLCLSAERSARIEAWGALHAGQLIAAFLAIRCDNTYSFLFEQSSTAHLDYRVNNALYFEATRQALCQPEIYCAFFGVNSLDAPASVDEFKFRMGMKPRPVRQQVVFNPLFEPLANPTVHRIVMAALRHAPQNYLLAKAEGMLRFHLQGRLPLEEQDWPECLSDKKSGLSQAVFMQNSLS